MRVGKQAIVGHGCGGGMLFLHSAHFHAQMFAAAGDNHSLGANSRAQAFGQLRCEALLELGLL